MWRETQTHTNHTPNTRGHRIAHSVRTTLSVCRQHHIIGSVRERRRRGEVVYLLAVDGASPHQVGGVLLDDRAGDVGNFGGRQML